MSTITSKGTAIVTGATAGIGKVYADRLAKRGYDLILVARREERLNEIASSLQSKYRIKAHGVAADLSLDSDIQKIANLIETDTTITLLVNNAGVATLAPVTDTTLSELEAMNDINVKALVTLSYASLKKFKERNKGIIINIGSVLSFFSLPISSIYSGTKGYVMNFTRGLQAEVNDTDVFIQLVLPASTATELWDLSGVPLANLNQETVMSAENLVDAALKGLDDKELVTLPSVEDKNLWEAFDAARINLFSATQTGNVASRYQSLK